MNLTAILEELRGRQNDVTEDDIGKHRLDNIGDVDVLAADPPRNRLIVIECKDLSMSRTPHEFASEVDAMLHGRGGGLSIVDKHQRRVQWVRDHVPDTLRLFGIEPACKWRVESLLVVDEPLVTAYLRECPVTILTLSELKERMP